MFISRLSCPEKGLLVDSVTAADSCQVSDRYPPARKSTTRVLTRDIFQPRLWQPKYFWQVVGTNRSPKKKIDGYFWHDVVTSFRHISGFQKRALRTFVLVIWLCEKVWLKVKKKKKKKHRKWSKLKKNTKKPETFTLHHLCANGL